MAAPTSTLPTADASAATAAPSAPNPATANVLDVPPTTTSTAVGTELPSTTTATGATGDVHQDGSFLQHAKDLAKPYLDQVDKSTRPYVEKVQQSTKPYTDAALAKGKELNDYIQGKGEGVATDADGVAVAADGTATTGVSAAPKQDLGEKAKGLFSYGLASVKSAVNTVGATIDSKTATPEKPGLFTQASSVVQRGMEQIEKTVGPVAPASGASHPGVAGAGVDATGFSVHTDASAPSAAATKPSITSGTAQSPTTITTTNTVPHNDAAAT